MKRKIRKHIPILLPLIPALLLAGCGSAADTENEVSVSDSETVQEQTDAGAMAFTDCYLVTNVYGDGQKPWYIVLEYSDEIDPDSISADDYEMKNYDIEAVYTNTESSLPGESTAGSYVLIELSTDYTTSNYGGSGSGSSEFSGGNMYGDREDLSNDTESDFGDGGPTDGDFDESDFEEREDLSDPADSESREDRSDLTDSDEREGLSDLTDSDDREDLSGRTDIDDSETDGGQMQGGRGNMSSASSASNQLSVTFRQTGEIAYADGSSLSAWEEDFSTDYTENINLLVENFTQYTFTLSDGTEMMYSLYLPENYSENSEYPLVLFMPDATGEGDDEYLALTESLGGVIWTTEEWQEEHETIVLVPQYVESNTEDPACTMELLYEIAENYSVDTTREYLVGQSSGTIRSIKMLIDYPDEFAGAFLVAGQTDSAYEDSISALSSQNIWMVCSEGDARAYPGMTGITEAVESAGTDVTTAQWSAALTDDEQEQFAEEQASAGTSINWTIFDVETVMRDDVTSSDATEHMNTWRVAYNLDTIREWLFSQTK
ncbi:MAG: hypothetical protein LUF32_07765 [Clostridiales bacterium]|nr:hypothetical protein [Clostridiales bacterium]